MKIKQFTFNPFQENTYVLYNEDNEALIIDPGCFDRREEELLSNFILSKNLTVKLLVNTHLHIDHVLGNAFVENTYNVKALANQEDEFWLKGLEAQARMFGMDLKHSTPSLGEYIREGDQLSLGTEIFEIYQVPGHSPGSIVLYNEKNRCVFVGDVLFENSIGRSDLQGGNHQLLIDGIQSKLLTLPDDTVVYPGHGSSTTIGAEKANNPFL